MGFLSKLFKKAKPFLPIALSMFGPGLMAGMGAKFGLGSLFSGMNPMAANMLKQSLMGYGTAALSGSKRPGKAAMYAGLASLPFSYMSAAQGANAFNEQYAGNQGMERYLKSPGVGFGEGLVDPRLARAAGMGTINKPATYGFQKYGSSVPKLSAWDIMSGRAPEGMAANLPDTLRSESYKFSDDAVRRLDPTGKSKYLYEDIVKGEPFDMPGADIFSKVSRGGKGFGGKQLAEAGTRTADWLPTMASQTAAMYGGRMTPEEEWEESQKRRKKELAWMYGVPEDMIEGEMTNPWSSGSFWNRGGIASLENGGDVSGPGSGTSDSINANLSDGEFVMTAKAVENLGNGDRYTGARKMYDLMNVLDPESETMSEVI
jgi:hypothetical protein